MIPVTSTITQVDTLPGEEIEFTIGDPRWVMRTQADLYSNRELAVVREYSTNAADANKEAGLNEPIEVTLPSMMNPYFKVRDFGPGMSRAVLGDVYTKFGSSTKRGSNDFNGMLGYGSKSAVAYTNTFTVTSIHNGLKTVAVVTRKDDWSIVMKVLSTSQTSERSGTEVVVPVHNWQEFTQKANDFYKFWLPGTVKVNGAEPVHNVGKKIIDGLYMSNHWNESYVVMGNVAYRINNPSALFHDSNMNHINFVAYVDNGDVEFTPSREDLKYTEQTKTELQNIVNRFEAKIVAKANDEISKATTHAEAFALWSEWTESLGRNLFADLTFKGNTFRSDFALRGDKYGLNYNYRNAVQSISKYNVEAVAKTLFVTDFNINLTAKHKRMAKEFIRASGLDMNSIVFMGGNENDITCPWITFDNFYSWDSIKNTLPKPPRQPRTHTASGRPAGSFDYITATATEVGKPVPTNIKNLFYIHSQKEKDVNVKHMLDLVGITDAAVIVLHGNRIAKFNRDYPNVKEFMGFCKAKVVLDAPSLLSKDAKRAMSYSSHVTRWLERLDIDKVDDPDVAKAKADVANLDALSKRYRNNLALANQTGLGYTVKKHQPVLDGWFDKRYPLLDRINFYQSVHSHTYLYMNAAYAAESE